MWSDAPNLDPDAIARLLRLGGPGFVTELLRLFEEQGTQRVAAISGAHAVGNVDEVRRAAHSLVSTAGNLGARRLQGLATALERAAATHDTATLAALVPALPSALDAAREALTTCHTENRA
ncbi:MAG: Hpt domain-containing protein [Gemmatimonadaceae bacterium]|jgi:HPt (histidine-containing phosphotransfer) domain-containing protein|nr:Hpt domain-containing protein [Gemmatimonadaceae bacterium]